MRYSIIVTKTYNCVMYNQKPGKRKQTLYSGLLLRSEDSENIDAHSTCACAHPRNNKH